MAAFLLVVTRRMEKPAKRRTPDIPEGNTFLPGFHRPLHVNVSGLADADAVRYVLGLYDGHSVLVNAKAELRQRHTGFSRVGGIYAGMHAYT